MVCHVPMWQPSTGGIGVHLKSFCSMLLLLLLLRDHRDRHNLIAQLNKLPGTLKWSENFCSALQRTEAVVKPTKECSGNNVVDVTVLITQSAVQWQTFQLAFLIATKATGSS